MLAPRTRRWIYAPLLFGFLASSCTHGSLILALLFGASGGAGGSGENGNGGSGGGETTIDISYPGSTTSPAAPGVVATASPQTAPTATPETKSPEKTEEKIDPNGDVTEQITPPVKQAIASPLPPLPNATGNSGTTGGGKSVGPTRIGFPNTGFAAGDGSSVEGQRALLPAAVTCGDPVAGRWEALKYHPTMGGWVRFKLVVGHNPDGTVSGTIISHTWSGSPSDHTPPPCELGGFNIIVSMNAHGHVDDAGRITFGSSSFTIVSEECPSFGTTYSPDNFSGVIDSQRQEFQSLNNDGANDVNAPYVFRRTGCL